MNCQHFNDLTPAEAERLACLAEEAAEVAQIAMKILRHGYGSYHPKDATQTENRELLAREVGNFAFVFHKMQEEGDISSAHVLDGQKSKEDNWPRFTHHQPESH